jgi:hypothetical protein
LIYFIRLTIGSTVLQCRIRAFRRVRLSCAGVRNKHKS